jgi:hypothetical protein
MRLDDPKWQQNLLNALMVAEERLRLDSETSSETSLFAETITLRRIDERTGSEFLKIDYPQIKGHKPPSIDHINKIIRDWASFADAEMVRITGSSTDSESDTVFSGLSSFLNIGHSIALLSDIMFSIVFDVSTFFAGAAHPMHSFKTFNFIIHNGKTVELADIILPQNLQRLSSIIENEFRLNNEYPFDEHWLHRGLDPKYENFKHFVVTKNGISFYFPPYQLSSYSAGPFVAPVTRDQLKETVNREYFEILFGQP